MIIIEKAQHISETIEKLRNKGKTIGFVPTMGALHKGHISLISRSVAECDVTVASIFVNPTQFNELQDLKNYPRTFEADKKMLEEAGCDIIFYPSVEEIYPTEVKEKYSFGFIEEVMEGAHRPGHFNGVAMVVERLFRLVPADKAYFGEKDFQQLAIVKALVKQKHIPVNIVPCPIVRETDGLAMSSRNTLLTPDERKTASSISKTLFAAKELAKTKNPEEIKTFVIDQIASIPAFQLEYFDIVDALSLVSIKNWDDSPSKNGCIALRIGKVRLIDNISF
jgi:pantoate--beta-alanine ligase